MGFALLAGRVVLVVALGGLACWGVASADAAEISPHKAIYDLSLIAAKPSSGVVNIGGTLTYRIADTCEGWAVDQQFKMRLEAEGDEPTEIVSSFATVESKDGLRYRFNQKRTRDGKVEEELSGDATLKSVGGVGRARFSQPRDEKFDLPAGTQFPTAHLLQVLKKAEQGESFVPVRVFDGANLEGASLLSTVIGKAKPTTVAKNETGIDRALLSETVWQLRMAAFPVDEKAEMPNYEIGLRLTDHAVSDEIILDYGDYSILARLKNLESLPPRGC